MRKIRLLYLVGAIALLAIVSVSNVRAIPMQTTDKWGTNWRPYGAYVDEVKFVVYTEGETPLAMLALSKGEVDAYDERVLDDYQWGLIIDEDINVSFTPSVRYRALTLDCSHFPLDMTAFRRAIAFGFDKYRANTECIGGVGQPQDSYIPLISTEWEVESKLPTKFYESDFISGNKSLANAHFIDLDGDGWREYDANNNSVWDAGIDRDHDKYTDEGGIMSMSATAGYDPAIIACQIAVEGLAKMGVKAEVVEMDFNAIFEELFAGNAWVACWTEGVPFVNTVKLLYDNFAIGGQGNVEPYNYYHFTNATISAILEQMVASTNITFIKEKAAEASLMLAFEQPQIVCYNDVNIGAHRTDKFEGFFTMAGAGVASGDNWACATKVHLKESEGGPYGGTFKYCLSDNMNTLNPYLQKTGYEATVFQYIYETLWNTHPTIWDPMPGLAYDWDIETTTASGDILDGQKFTFYLYENETWHDGEPFTSKDINHSIYMWRDSPFVNPEMEDIYKIVLPDDYTIELYVNETGFFEFADTTSFYVTPEHIWKDVTNVSSYAPTLADVIGTGPYYMAARVPGEYISLLRHEDWRWAVEHVEPTSTPVSTSEPADTKTKTKTKTSEGGATPGFELIPAFAVVVAAAVVIRKRRK
jgi:ABC-type transport system substrate-binding protein